MHIEIQKHYAQLLGLQSPWKIQNVELKLKEKCVDIELGLEWGSPVQCSICGCECSIYDSAEERTWRHLDMMQFRTDIRAKVPRADCPTHGVLTVAVPWAGPRSRFTLLFERMAIEVLKASASIQSACEWLKIGWESAQAIMRRGVERGMERRELEELKHLGLDEKSFKGGQSYITVLTDLEESRVLEVVPERTQEAAEQVLGTLSPEQKEMVEAVAVDMWEPFVRAITAQMPEAAVVHDKYHVSAYLNKAVDEVRRQEHQQLQETEDQTLTGTRHLWLYNPQNWSEKQSSEFTALKDLNLKVGRAWGGQGIVHEVLGVSRGRMGAEILQRLVWLDEPEPSRADEESGADAQEALGELTDLYHAPDYQWSDGGVELQNTGSERGCAGFPKLPELPDSHLILLREVRSLPTVIREEPLGERARAMGKGADTGRLFPRSSTTPATQNSEEPTKFLRTL